MGMYEFMFTYSVSSSDASDCLSSTDGSVGRARGGGCVKERIRTWQCILSALVVAVGDIFCQDVCTFLAFPYIHIHAIRGHLSRYHAGGDASQRLYGCTCRQVLGWTCGSIFPSMTYTHAIFELKDDSYRSLMNHGIYIGPKHYSLARLRHHHVGLTTSASDGCSPHNSHSSKQISPTPMKGLECSCNTQRREMDLLCKLPPRYCRRRLVQPDARRCLVPVTSHGREWEERADRKGRTHGYLSAKDTQ